jgi:hypothetical protein
MESELKRVSEKVERAGRDSHSQIWQRLENFLDAEGNTVIRTNIAFVQLETGMHYRDGEEWKATRELIEPIPGGAVAQHGPHKVIFAENLNTAGAIDMETPDGKRLRSHVLGLAYVDTATGSNVFIAELKDCHGEIVNSNQVVYSDAFKGLKADVRYTYTKAGFEQDIILRSQPPATSVLGFTPETTRLQVFTEFLDVPQPGKQEMSFQDATGDDRTDEFLDFGDMKIGTGRAFSIGEGAGKGVPVGKKWTHQDGRTFLVEEVAVTEVSERLSSLPRTAFLSRPSKNSLLEKINLPLPSAPQTAVTHKRKMLIAKLELPKPGLVLDYAMLNGNLQNYTFKGDTTYYISDNVILLNTTTIEGGTVVKYAPGKSVQLSSSVVCKTGPYRPAIFTARDDDTVGEILTGISTGTPSGYYANTALSAPSYSSPTLSYLRISYAAQGLYFNYVGGPSLTVRNMQFVSCQVGIATYNCSMGIKVRNALFKNVATVFSMYSGYSAGTPDAQYITVDGSTWLWATSHPYGQGIFKNCVFANVSGLITPSGGASVGGDPNGFYNAPSFGSSPTTVFSSPFQIVGAGTCYLDPSSGFPFLNIGTTTGIDSTLLAELKLKTTAAPTDVFDNVTISAGTTWSPSLLVPRDTDTPDLGYHYEPLDVCVSRVTLAGTLTINAGTAVGYFGTYGFRNGIFSIQGSPIARNPLAHYSAVQEQPVPAAPWGANANASYFLKNGEMPALNWRFAEVFTANGSYFGGGAAKNADVKHSELYAARMTCDSGSLVTQGFTNNILQRCTFAYGMCAGAGYSVKFGNNLFLNSGVTAGYFCYPGFASSIASHNNLFAGSSFTWSGWGSPQNSHNGYYNSTVTSPGTSPVNIATLDFQTGPLGPFYYPTAVSGQNLATLIDAGSSLAQPLGLDTFTTRTDQGFDECVVDIGFHYGFSPSPSTGTLSINTTLTASQLAEKIMAGSGVSVVPNTASYVGASYASGGFEGGKSAGLPLDEGAILTTGDANLAIGPNDDSFATAENGLSGDVDLDNLIVNDPLTLDASVLTFQVVSSTPITFTFRFVFASDEYPEFVGDFNDFFAIFLNGINIAFAPGTTLPTGVNTINGGSIPENFCDCIWQAVRPEYYIDNHDPGPTFSSLPPYRAVSPKYNLQYDGMTQLLTVPVTLSANSPALIKIAIADSSGAIGTDDQMDTAVFIATKSQCP